MHSHHANTYGQIDAKVVIVNYIEMKKPDGYG